MRKNLMLSLLFGILIMGFIFLPAARADDSCWESTETNPGGSELISKVENPVHCVFDDDPSPYDTYESYPIWVYGRDFNVVAYTNIRVKIYVKAFFHIDFYYFGQKVGESENWGSAPYGMFKWNGDYIYGSETPVSVSWSVRIGGQTEDYSMSVSASYYPIPVSYYGEVNNEYGEVTGNWRYMGYLDSRYATPMPWQSAAQEFTALLRLHVIHSVAEDYYEGVPHSEAIGDLSITYVQALRFKLVFEFNGGFGGPFQDSHTHVMGNGVPSGEDINGIPLCIGDVTAP